MRITRKLRVPGDLLVGMYSNTTRGWTVRSNALPADARCKGVEVDPRWPKAFVLLIESDRWPENCPDELEPPTFRDIALP